MGMLVSQEKVQMLISFVFSESCPLFQFFLSYNFKLYLCIMVIKINLILLSCYKMYFQ